MRSTKAKALLLVLVCGTTAVVSASGRRGKLSGQKRKRNGIAELIAAKCGPRRNPQGQQGAQNRPGQAHVQVAR